MFDVLSVLSNSFPHHTHNIFLSIHHQKIRMTQSNDVSSDLLGGQRRMSIHRYTNLNLTWKDHIHRLHVFSKQCLVISIFFWCWALKNTMEMTHNFDLGLVSFFCSGCGAYFLFSRTKDDLSRVCDIQAWQRFLVVGSQLIVSFNYGLGTFSSFFSILLFVVLFGYDLAHVGYWTGAYLAFTLGTQIYYSFFTYCFVFTFLWFFAAVHCWKLVTNTMNLRDIEEDSTVVDATSFLGSSIV
jgi:hypothetical protein